MGEQVSDVPRSVARGAWERLASHGSATSQVTRVLGVGIDEYIELFAGEYLGSDGTQTFKLILGLNGEGKTHLLRRLEQMALDRGHVVAFVEAKNAGIAESPFAFGRQVLMGLTVATSSEKGDDHPLALLLRAAVTQKRVMLAADGVTDVEAVLPEWADGFRGKNLQPLLLAQAISDGLHAVIRSDMDRLVAAITDLSLENVRVPQAERAVQGSALLRSIARVPRLLGFQRLVLLVDEAEVAFEGLAQRRRQTLLTLLRYLNDHLTATDDDGAVVFLACADEMWPARFTEYAALRQRLSDPGADRVEDRERLSLPALVIKNKLWVRETFRGTFDDYKRLGDAILVVGNRVYSNLDVRTQAANAELLARLAASNEINRVVKRPFVKALAQLVQTQIADGNQRPIDEDEARGLFDLARRSAALVDSSEEEEE